MIPIVLVAALLPAALAVPAPVPVPHPMITPAARLEDRQILQRRGLLSDITSLGGEAESYISSVLGTYPAYVESGVANFFQGFPTGTNVESSLGISDGDLAATPTQALNIP